MPGRHRGAHDVLRRGDRSGAVVEIRAALAALGLLNSPDADLSTGKHVALDVFDDELLQAVRAFQQQRGLLVDGVIGEATFRALKEASYRLGARILNHQFGAPMYGDDIATLQARLQDLGFYTGMVDGYFGIQTHNALMSYQREYGLCADGICGPETLRSLNFLASRVSGGSPHAIREEELVRRSGPRLSGKRIVIDPGRGGSDHGLIAQTLRSDQRGRHAVGLGKSARRPDDGDRYGDVPVPAAWPRADGCGARRDRQCGGRRSDDQPALRGPHQPGGQRGGVVSLRQLARLGVDHRPQPRRLHSARDCGAHRFTGLSRSWPDLGPAASDSDAHRRGRRRLHHQSARSRFAGLPATRDAIAEGMLAAVKRLYLLGKNDRPTGTFTFAELLAHELSVEQAGRLTGG